MVKTLKKTRARRWSLRLLGGLLFIYVSALALTSQVATNYDEDALLLFHLGLFIAMPAALILIFALPLPKGPFLKPSSAREDQTA